MGRHQKPVWSQKEFHHRLFVFLLIAVGGLVAPGFAEVAPEPLFFGPGGQVWFEAPGGASIRVSPEGGVEIDGELLVVCSRQPGAKVKSRGTVAKCYPSYIKVEDGRGNVLKVYETFVKAEDDHGNEWVIQVDKGRVSSESGSRELESSARSNPKEESVDPRSKSTSTTEQDSLRVQTPGTTIELGGESGIEVQTPGATVSLGKTLRIRTPTGDTEVSAGWRELGSVPSSPAEKDRLLTSLGAIREGSSLRLRLAGDVLFDFDRWAIRPDAAATLSKVARVLRLSLVGPARVEGHTDSLGSDSHNQRLSEQRALAVMTWLHEKEGVPIHLLLGRGFGASKPIAANNKKGRDHPAGRALNRRVEILVPTEVEHPEPPEE
ncbi:MAG: OmpA family protein [Deltaproteobacteria bacterium]|nr:OmpA family protein [Deltaproteobacteria bacterium]